ncbi:MAG: ABC-2 family transporter protein [Alphaproteobacteria bacterium]|nr:ABC-2 family transporter protein [Alphaproteobacteria bacterium]
MSASPSPWRAFPALLRVGFAESVAYRAEMLIWFLAVTMPIIMMFVWDRVAEAGPVGGMDQQDLGRYFLAMVLVRQLTGAWVVWELNYEIRDGSLNGWLLKPMHLLWFSAARHLAAHPFRLVVLGPLVGALLLWRPELAFWPGLGTLALAALSVALAWGIGFAFQVAFGALAFFLKQSSGVWGVWFGAYMLLSGYIFPIGLAPPWLQPVLRALPFRFQLSVPVEILTGLLSGTEALAAFVGQLIWLLLSIGLAAATWRFGVGRYEAVGS